MNRDAEIIKWLWIFKQMFGDLETSLEGNINDWLL